MDKKQQHYISRMLDDLENKKQKTDNKFKLKVLNRLIEILEEYTKTSPEARN